MKRYSIRSYHPDITSLQLVNNIIYKSFTEQNTKAAHTSAYRRASTAQGDGRGASSTATEFHPVLANKTTGILIDTDYRIIILQFPFPSSTFHTPRHRWSFSILRARRRGAAIMQSLECRTRGSETRSTQPSNAGWSENRSPMDNKPGDSQPHSYWTER